MTDVKGGGGR